MKIKSIEELQAQLRDKLYIADRGLATAIYLALKLERPLFLEGEAGVGKTEIAKVLTELLDTELIRLQCYEGLDVNQAVYEWNYTRQMMHIRLAESRGEKLEEKDLFGPEFLLKRPLLKAIDASAKKAPVLLIDEVDRSDEEFEAYLLELLSDFQVTIEAVDHDEVALRLDEERCHLGGITDAREVVVGFGMEAARRVRADGLFEVLRGGRGIP